MVGRDMKPFEDRGRIFFPLLELILFEDVVEEVEYLINGVDELFGFCAGSGTVMVETVDVVLRIVLVDLQEEGMGCLASWSSFSTLK